jgi:hypothetical protein
MADHQVDQLRVLAGIFPVMEGARRHGISSCGREPMAGNAR